MFGGPGWLESFQAGSQQRIRGQEKGSDGSRQAEQGVKDILCRPRICNLRVTSRHEGRGNSGRIAEELRQEIRNAVEGHQNSFRGFGLEFERCLISRGGMCVYVKQDCGGDDGRGMFLLNSPALSSLVLCIFPALALWLDLPRRGGYGYGPLLRLRVFSCSA